RAAWFRSFAVADPPARGSANGFRPVILGGRGGGHPAPSAYRSHGRDRSRRRRKRTLLRPVRAGRGRSAMVANEAGRQVKANDSMGDAASVRPLRAVPPWRVIENLLKPRPVRPRVIRRRTL